MGVHTILAVLSQVAVVVLVNGVGPYTVNNQKTGCRSDGLLDFETGNLDVMRGSRGAPCVGYLTFAARAPGPGLATNRICSEAGSLLLFYREAAKRACWTLGTNLYRDPNTGEEIMLYSCDSYMEENVDFPNPGGSAPVSVATDGLILGPLQGKRCPLPLNADEDCFGECYGIIRPNDFLANGDESDCGVLIPYWATTCSDIDECLNGVHGNCEGPFDEHCTLRIACGPNTKCTNIPGSWSCECRYGYKYTDSSNPYDTIIGCEDINECEDEDICGKNGQCRNTNGSYFCICTSRELWDKDTGKCTLGQCSAAPSLSNAFTTSTPAISEYGDEVTYHCNTGYHVAGGQLSGLVPTYYGYSILTSFELTCNAHGEWGPQPFPECVPVYCGDPGVVPNTARSGNDFRFAADVHFNCPKGYGIRNGYNYDESFTVTCQADGTWTDVQYCEDVVECSQSPSPCGVSSKRCINTMGSYFCVCASGYYQDDNDEYSCAEVEPEAFPGPCKIMESIQFCDHGACTMDDDKARCTCDAGYEGKACDRPIISHTLIIAAVALALVCFFILIHIIYCIFVICRPRVVPVPAPVYGPRPIDPIYAKRPLPRRALSGQQFPF